MSVTRPKLCSVILHLALNLPLSFLMASSLMQAFSSHTPLWDVRDIEELMTTKSHFETGCNAVKFGLFLGLFSYYSQE